MNTKEAKQSVQMDKALFDFYGKPSIGQSLPLAIQHVLAMIVGCVTPSIIVAGVAGLSQEDSVILIQAALVMSALTTLIQLFPSNKLKIYFFAFGRVKFNTIATIVARTTGDFPNIVVTQSGNCASDALA